MTPPTTEAVAPMAPTELSATSKSPYAAKAKALAKKLLKVHRELKEARKQIPQPPATSCFSVNANKDQPLSAESIRVKAQAEEILQLRHKLAARIIPQTPRQATSLQATSPNLLPPFAPFGRCLTLDGL